MRLIHALASIPLIGVSNDQVFGKPSNASCRFGLSNLRLHLPNLPWLKALHLSLTVLGTWPVQHFNATITTTTSTTTPTTSTTPTTPTPTTITPTTPNTIMTLILIEKTFPGYWMAMPLPDKVSPEILLFWFVHPFRFLSYKFTNCNTESYLPNGTRSDRKPDIHILTTVNYHYDGASLANSDPQVPDTSAFRRYFSARNSLSNGISDLFLSTKSQLSEVRKAWEAYNHKLSRRSTQR